MMPFFPSSASHEADEGNAHYLSAALGDALAAIALGVRSTEPAARTPLVTAHPLGLAFADSVIRAHINDERGHA